MGEPAELDAETGIEDTAGATSAAPPDRGVDVPTPDDTGNGKWGRSAGVAGTTTRTSCVLGSNGPVALEGGGSGPPKKTVRGGLTSGGTSTAV